MKASIVCSALLLALSCSTSRGQTQDELPANLLVLRAQPAVFQVWAIGDGEVTYPKTQWLTLGANAQSLLENEYQRDQRDGVVALGKSKAEYFWEKIAENPDRYLFPSLEQETWSFRGLPYASGTAFAVSRGGVLLTNAHVVADSSNVSPQLLSSLVLNTLQRLGTEFGRQPGDTLKPALAGGLARWFAARSRANIRFREAQVVLKFGYDPTTTTPTTNGLLRSKSFGALFAKSLQQKPLTAPVDVVAKGEPYPGEDVAVLKIRGTAAEWTKRLICLTLGNSADVVPGAPVWAMGFPGIGFDPGAMQSEAAFRVSSRDGRIGQTKPVKGGWEAFEMNADIHHGDSGGPVIDQRGLVIGLNVAGPEGAGGQNLAVPINVARKYLRQAGVNPDPGPLTAQWVIGLRLFASGKYREAQQKFRSIEEIQNGDRPEDEPEEVLALPGFGLSFSRTRVPRVHFFDNTANPYIIHMIVRCEQELGTMPKRTE